MSVEAVLVIDTNFLIDHLSFLTDLITILEADPIAWIVIPFQVIQELDKLKSSLVKTQAIAANNYLNTAFKVSKVIKGSPRQIINNDDSNDDLILDVAISWKHHCKFVLLATNDVNLSIKGRIHDMQIISKPIIPPINFFHQLKGLIKENGIFEFGQPSRVQPFDHAMDIDQDSMISDLDCGIDGILNDLINLIEINLNPALKILLERVYGSDWTVHVKQDWPWNINDIFSILLDHELIAFTCIPWKSISSRSQLRNMAKDLERSVRFNKTLVTIGDLLQFCKDLEYIFTVLKVVNLNYEDCNNLRLKMIDSLERF